MNRTIPQIVSVVFIVSLLGTGRSAVQQSGPVAFDIRTAFSEKPELAPVKNGTALPLMESDRGGVREYGEEDALWLRNIHRGRTGDSIVITLDAELRAPSLFGQEELRKSRSVTAAYHPEDD